MRERIQNPKRVVQRNKNFLHLFIGLFILFGCSQSNEDEAPQNETLTLEISSPKKKYKLGEYIRFSASLKNISGDSIAVNSDFTVCYEENGDGEIFFRIFDEAGNRYDKTTDHTNHYSPIGSDLKGIVKLATNQSVEGEAEFSLLYDIQTPGKYFIQAGYKAQDFDIKKGAFSKLILSERIEIEIQR